MVKSRWVLVQVAKGVEESSGRFAKEDSSRSGAPLFGSETPFGAFRTR